MKIRINGSTLQFRLSVRDLDSLNQDKCIETRLEILDGLSWRFALSLDPHLAAEALAARTDQIELMLPAEQFQKWNLSHEIEWEFKTSNSPLTFLIEKDLKGQSRQ